ncbi:hypothetical protein [Anaeromyxobacter paludicola]|uniref:Uncharacterized protein n=1 Tax=Anaeromyxobacter paludicola TaxID=2918171 RepID=A0ABN6N6P4_9BACT|nr:hypothetical protein [Anaeromyxobacter paludicola]BDG07597.1 hypothetical protein AMPC_07100 [Anaeromyxobacter paludicola]
MFVLPLAVVGMTWWFGKKRAAQRTAPAAATSSTSSALSSGAGQLLELAGGVASSAAPGLLGAIASNGGSDIGVRLPMQTAQTPAAPATGPTTGKDFGTGIAQDVARFTGGIRMFSIGAPPDKAAATSYRPL